MDDQEVKQCFTPHKEQNLLSECVVASWCPTMDLLALATQDGQLCLHRLNWERLWTVTPEHQVTTLAWRPDGKALAAGQQDGTVVLYDAENGEKREARRVHATAITAASWVAPPPPRPGSRSYTDRTPQYLPNLPEPPPMPVAPNPMQMATFGYPPGLSVPPPVPTGPPTGGHWAACSSSTNVLSVADCCGNIAILVFGVYPLVWTSVISGGAGAEAAGGPLEGGGWEDRRSGSAAASAAGSPAARPSPSKPARGGGGPSGTVLIAPSSSLHYTTVVTAAPAGDEGTGEARTGEAGLHAHILSTALLNHRRAEVQHVALQASYVTSHLGDMQSVLRASAKTWQEARKAFRGKLQSLEEVLRDHGGQGTPQEDLLLLLTCGAASPGLHSFLCSTLGESGVRRLAKQMDVAAMTVHHQLCEHLLPAAQTVVLRVSELRGLARMEAEAAGLGLEAAAVGAMLARAERVLVVLAEVLCAAAATAAQMRSFFIWLLRATRQLDRDQHAADQSPALPPIDLTAVAEFLSVHWERDRLTPHLESGAEGEQPPSSGPGSRPDQSSTSTAAQTLHSVLANAAPEGISESGTGRGAGRGTEPGGGWTLRREVERLSEQCAEAVRHTSAVVSSTLQPAARFLLLPAPPPAHSGALCVSHSSPCPDLPPEHQYLAFAASCLPPSGQAPAPASAAPVGGGAGGGSGGGGVQTPCVVRITFAEPEPREAERDPQAAPFCLEACALTLPEGEGVIDLAFCKGAELVLLTGSPAPDCRGAARLTVVPCEDLPFRPVLPRGPDLLHQCRQAGATAHLAAHLWRARDLNHGGALRPLAVSPRQIACTFVGSQRVVYYDLAEDEDSGEDEDMEEDD